MFIIYILLPEKLTVQSPLTTTIASDLEAVKLETLIVWDVSVTSINVPGSPADKLIPNNFSYLLSRGEFKSISTSATVGS